MDLPQNAYAGLLSKVLRCFCAWLRGQGASAAISPLEKKIIVFFKKFWTIFFVFIPVALTAYGNSVQERLEIRGEHFIVYFDKEYTEFAQKVEDSAEKYYSSIALDLGYVRYSNFWTWDNRVKIFLYRDHKSYLEASGEKEWSHGMANYNTKEISSYAGSRGFLETLLPHEIAHLIFRDFVGFKGDVPLWLDEGVAQWEEKAKREQLKELVKGFYQKQVLLPLKFMMDTDIRNVKESDKISVDSRVVKDGYTNTIVYDGSDLVKIYYIQAFSLVGFLMEQYGADNFVGFCRNLRDGKNIADALKYSYPGQINSLLELEQKWQQYIADM